MLLQYGHCEIEWQGETYRLAPTFANIAKIGSPVEIIDDFKSFISTSSIMQKFCIALTVLNSCSDKSIPETLTGRYQYSERKNRFLYVQPSHGLPMVADVITLAEHCLIHGICGKADNSGEGEPLKEFNAYEFMELSRVHLGMSAGEAANMTMTEFSRMMAAKFPPEKPEGPSDDERNDLLAWLESTEVH